MILLPIHLLISLIILAVIVYYGVEGDCMGATSGKTIFAVFIGVLHLLLFLAAFKGYSNIQDARKKKRISNRYVNLHDFERRMHGESSSNY